MRKVFFIPFFFILSEILVIIGVSSILGFATTFFLVITSTVFGIWMCRTQGLRSFHQAKIHFAQSVQFREQVLSSAGSLVSGFLLIIPGLITSFIAVVILIPGLKTFIFHKVLWYFSEKLLTKHTKHSATSYFDDSIGPVVDGEYENTTTQKQEERSDEQSRINLEKG